MKCPKCHEQYDEKIYSQCPFCGYDQLDSSIRLGKTSIEASREIPDEIAHEAGENFIGDPISSEANKSSDKAVKKKKSILFYLAIAFVVFVLFTTTFIGITINSFIKNTLESNIGGELLLEDESSEANNDMSLDFDPFDNDKDKYLLDVSHIYEYEDAFYEDVNKLKYIISPKFRTYKDKLASRENIKAVFELYDEGYFITEKLYWYAQYQVSIDASNEEFQNLADEADSVIQEFTEATSYILPELTSYDEDKLRYILNYEGISKEEYEATVNQILQMKKHILSTETEDALAILASFNNSPKNIWDKLTVLDPFFEVYRMDNGQIIDFSDDKSVERYQNDPEQADRIYDYYVMMNRQNENALAEILMSELQKNIAYSKIKKYDNFLEYELSSDGVPQNLYLNLIKSTKANLHLLHRYQLLEDKMYEYNLLPELSTNFSISEAREILSETYSYLGDDYRDDFNYALDNNWIDLVPSEFKEEGAYTSGMKEVHPYIIMSYYGGLYDLSTLTHEYGHMANYRYSQEAVDSTSWTPNNFTAEVPSIFNEAILSEYLRDNAKTTDEKLAYLNNELNLINDTFFFQAMLSEFQYKIYKEVENGNLLTADELNKLFGSLYIEYYGDSFKDYLFDETSGYWSNIPHFYNGFYVYKYSTSLAIAYSVKEHIDSNDISVQDYLDFLEHGSVISPEESLKTLNIDLYSDAWMDDLFDYYEILIDELEYLLEVKESEA